MVWIEKKTLYVREVVESSDDFYAFQYEIQLLKMRYEIMNVSWKD